MEISKDFSKEVQQQEIRFLGEVLDGLETNDCKRVYMQGYFDRMRKDVIPVEQINRREYSLSGLDYTLILGGALTNYLIKTARQLGMNREVGELEEGVKRGINFFKLMDEVSKQCPEFENLL